MPKSRRRAVFAILLFFSLTAVAFADSASSEVLNEYTALLKKMKFDNLDKKAIGREIGSLQSKKNEIKLSKGPKPTQAYCDICVEMVRKKCNAAKSTFPRRHICVDEECFVSLDPKKDLCHRLFMANTCYRNALSPDDRAKVRSCWTVDNLLKMNELDSEIIDLEVDQKQSEDALGEVQSKISAMEEDFPDLKTVQQAMEDCPNCEVAKKIPDKNAPAKH